jgi:hypothetical protein
VINDLSVLINSRMTFVDIIGSCVLKLARMLGFIKRISKEFNDPYTYMQFVLYSFRKWLLFLGDFGD